MLLGPGLPVGTADKNDCLRRSSPSIDLFSHLPKFRSCLVAIECSRAQNPTIRTLGQIGSAEWVPTAQMYGNRATKLLRISQEQMERLARKRPGLEQVVRHVRVYNRGAQAVIADNLHTAGD